VRQIFSIRWIVTWATIASLTACSGNSSLEGRFAPDPSLSPNGTSLPIDNPESAIPAEIPRYPQAQLLPDKSTLAADRGTIHWTSTDPVNLVEQYFQDQLTQQSWQISQSFSQTGENQPLIASKEGLELRIAIATSSSNR